MNAQRRKRLEALHEMLNVIHTELGDILEAEQEAFDNMPEAFRDGDKGSAVEGLISELDDAVADLDSAMGSISEAFSQ